MTNSIRRNVDVRRMGSAVSYPGIDPRTWVSLATVMEIGFDPDEGLFADVQLMPDGDIMTAYVGQPYAGGGFGAHFPMEVDDTVVVVIPGGDANGGPVIIARAWNAADKPPAEVGDGEADTKDVLIRVKDGQSFRLVVNGGEIVLTNESGNVLIDGDQILLRGATQAFARGNDLATALNNFANALVTAAAPLAPLPPTTPLTGAQGATFVTSLTAAATALAGAASSYLSQTIKGE